MKKKVVLMPTHSQFSGVSDRKLVWPETFQKTPLQSIFHTKAVPRLESVTLKFFLKNWLYIVFFCWYFNTNLDVILANYGLIRQNWKKLNIQKWREQNFGINKAIRLDVYYWKSLRMCRYYNVCWYYNVDITPY